MGKPAWVMSLSFSSKGGWERGGRLLLKGHRTKGGKFLQWKTVFKEYLVLKSIITVTVTP